MFAVAVLIFALAALASYWLARRIARPLQALRATAEQYAAGDLTQRPPLSDIEEVAALAEAMKTMARQIDERIQLLSRARAESEAVLASMVEGVLAVNNAEAVIRLILDNHSAHISKETRAYLATRPNRFCYVHTPTHGSWLNLVETLFGKMARTFLRGMRVASWEELRERILRGIAEINVAPVVHRWRKFEALEKPL